MMRITEVAAFTATLLFLGGVALAQHSTAVEAFSHYEEIRKALSADSTKGIAEHARMLAPLADALAGASAKTAAEGLAAAKTLDHARTHFGELSTVLVPQFQGANIPGAHAFVCAMKKRPWMQKGETIANPYYGKAMAGCGSPLGKSK